MMRYRPKSRSGLVGSEQLFLVTFSCISGSLKPCPLVILSRPLLNSPADCEQRVAVSSLCESFLVDSIRESRFSMISSSALKMSCRRLTFSSFCISSWSRNVISERGRLTGLTLQHLDFLLGVPERLFGGNDHVVGPLFQLLAGPAGSGGCSTGGPGLLGYWQSLWIQRSIAVREAREYWRSAQRFRCIGIAFPSSPGRGNLRRIPEKSKYSLSRRSQ